MKTSSTYARQCKFLMAATTAMLVLIIGVSAFAQPTYVPGGTLDPTTIPKYVTPLVIPPVMPKSAASPAPAAEYDIAVRQFQQQILPGGIWGSSFPNPLGGAPVGPFPATTIWSYGRAADPLPDSSAIPGGAAGVAPATNSTFNYPAFTVENTSAVATSVRWINDLVDPGTGNYRPHLFAVDQTLHWANPPKANCIMMPANRTDCETDLAAPYTGPVPFVTHVHGAHVQPHSDGHPEAWWLPGAPGTKGIPASYAERGTKYGQGNAANAVPGSAYFTYENTQPAATIWYHDHALGMTRLNVYAGPAGFWLIRGGANDTAAGVLPGPAPTLGGGDPNFTAAVRETIREVPIAIQDRSFNADGALFYPNSRTFFDGFTGPFIGGTGVPAGPSDISPIWNPEAFFNTIVVNGTTWPKFEVAPARYRLRLLNGCNSRALNLSMFVVTAGVDGIFGTTDDVVGAEVPFYQIGGDQGFLPNVVRITKGFTTTLPGNGTIPAAVAAPSPEQALLMMSAERADVIVDFGGLANGTHVRIFNTAPDSPFGGFPPGLVGYVPADLGTTGQVMDFIVNTALPAQPTDTSSLLPENIVLPAPAALGAPTNTRQVSLNELSSDQVCVEMQVIDGAIIGTLFSTFAGDPNFLANCAAATVGPGNFASPMGPRQAQLGILTTSGLNLVPLAQRWGDQITENPTLNSTEVWEIYNTTADAHPIHLHLVAFEVVNREDLDAAALALGNLVPTGVTYAPQPNELGYKDTVLALPSQITRLKAKFDIPGLYVWHCHIVEHEDNEMMRAYIVHRPSVKFDFNANGRSDLLLRNATTGQTVLWFMNVDGTRASYQSMLTGVDWSIVATGDVNGDGVSDVVWRNSVTGQAVLWFMNAAGARTSYKSLLTDPNWTIVGAGDFNDDGRSDLLWRNTVSGQVDIWFMNIDGTRSSLKTLLTNPGQTIAGVGDVNGDNIADIIWRNTATGQMDVWFMNADGTSSSINTLMTSLTWTIVGLGDVNKDGRSDILWRNTATGQAVLWFMNADGTRSSYKTLYTSLSWTIVGTADINGDGIADILWRSTTDGRKVVWFMNADGTFATQKVILSDANWAVTGY